MLRVRFAIMSMILRSLLQMASLAFGLPHVNQLIVSPTSFVWGQVPRIRSVIGPRAGALDHYVRVSRIIM